MLAKAIVTFLAIRAFHTRYQWNTCNPVAYIIPCHLIVPKEAIDKILAIRTVAQSTIFKGTDLYLLDSIEVGEYEYGSVLKRRLIERQLYGR